MAKQIVILGGGFGGIATARELERRLSAEEAEITLISRENFSLFTPMLPEVASGNLETRHIVTPIRAQLHRSRFVLGEVTSLDLAARRVHYEHPLLRTKSEIAFDQLVLALGSVTSTFGLPGIEEHTIPLKTLGDADRLRNHLTGMLELADVSRDATERRELLTFVFVGGGFTGVEAAGEAADFFRSVRRYYKTISREDVRIVLVEGGDKLLPGLQDGMGRYSAKALERRGIDVRLNEKVSAADARGLALKGGGRIEARTIIWSAGVKVSPVVSALPFAKGHGGSVPVERDLSVTGQPGLWAIGDNAQVPDGAGGSYGPTAQNAIREGPLLGANIAAVLNGRPTKAFTYKVLGMMASLGGRRGVAGLFGKYLVTGFLAWFLWRSYYLLRLPGVDRQLRVAFDWTLGLLFPRDIAELRVDSKAMQDDLADPGGASKPKADPAPQPAAY